MSFSTTLYRISVDLFRELESGSIIPNRWVSVAKEFVTFEDSTDAIIFILKRRNAFVAYDVEEIFSPKESIGSISDEEFQKLVETSNYKEIDRIIASTFYFLTPDKVIALNSFLRTFDDSELKSLYDSDALNSNNIYPALWSPGEDPDKGYSLSQLRVDFQALKGIFENASIGKDYILAFSG